MFTRNAEGKAVATRIWSALSSRERAMEAPAATMMLPTMIHCTAVAPELAARSREDEQRHDEERAGDEHGAVGEDAVVGGGVAAVARHDESCACADDACEHGPECLCATQKSAHDNAHESPFARCMFHHGFPAIPHHSSFFGLVRGESWLRRICRESRYVSAI